MAIDWETLVSEPIPILSLPLLPPSSSILVTSTSNSKKTKRNQSSKKCDTKDFEVESTRIGWCLQEEDGDFNLYDGVFARLLQLEEALEDYLHPNTSLKYDDDNDVTFPCMGAEVEPGLLAASYCFQRLSPTLRKVLRRKGQRLPTTIIAQYEEMVLDCIVNKSWSKRYNLYLDNPFQRLLLHSVCQYYGIVSNSTFDNTSTATGTRITFITIPKSFCGRLPIKSLVDYITPS